MLLHSLDFLVFYIVVVVLYFAWPAPSAPDKGRRSGQAPSAPDAGRRMWDRIAGRVGGYFSSNDIELASLTLQPDAAALMLLFEDSWATPLAAAARGSGGRLQSGERIPRWRLDPQDADLLDRPPGTGRPSERRLTAPFMDLAQQILELSGLVERGLLSAEEYERQRSRVLEP